MKDIRFRAWVKPIQIFTNRQYGYMIDVSVINFEEKWVSDDEGTVYDFHEIELMQYTELKDKKGVEIYEGDIVKTRKIFIKPRHTDFTEGEGKVIFSDCSFYILQVDSEEVIVGNYSPHSENTVTQIEVIGNIYENPELLED